MPIDFARIAALFEVALGGQLKSIKESFERLGKWLKARVEAANAIEQASRRFAVLAFEGSAVAARLHVSQHRAFLTAPPPGLGESFANAGRAFLRGIGRVAEAVREELILPNLLRLIEQVLETVLRSIERFERPGPSMFDPGARRASDLIGLLALAYRATASSTRQLRDVAAQLAAARPALAPPPAAADGTPPPPATLGLSLVEELDLAARAIVGAILLLPALPAYLALLAEAAWIRIRTTLIDEFAGIERQVFDLRRLVLDIFFVDLPALLVAGFRLVTATGTVVSANLQSAVAVGLAFVDQLLAEISRFANELVRFLNFWISMIEAVRRLFERIMNFDLMPFLVAPLGLPAIVLSALGALPTFTIGDLLDATGTAIRVSLRVAISAFIGSIRVAAIATIGYILYRVLGLRRKLNLLQDVVDALFQAPAPYPPEVAPPVLLGSFPNLFEAVFGSGSVRAGAAFAALGTRLAGDLRDLLRHGASFLESLSATFAESATAASRLGSPTRHRALTERAARLSDLLFGRQVEELDRRLAESRPDPVEQAFVQWIARGRFHVIGRAIPLYVEEMDRFWRQQSHEGREPTVTITPTSPHIVARRARLGRVRLRNLVIRAEGLPADASLVRAIAERFRESVENAYAAGFGIVEQARAG